MKTDHPALIKKFAALVADNAPEAKFAVIALFAEDGAPISLYAPGIPHPEYVREMLCRAISISYDPPVDGDDDAPAAGIKIK